MAEEGTEMNQVYSVRSPRQIRPILGSIIFLLAANLVAKGALALNTNFVPPLPNNIQGSLYLTLNGGQPHNSQTAQQQQAVWFPVQNQVPYTNDQPTSKPITQQQIISIGETLLTDESQHAVEDFKNRPNSLFIYNTQHDLVAEGSEKNTVTEKVRSGESTNISTTTEPEQVLEMIESSKPSEGTTEELSRQAGGMNTTEPTTDPPNADITSNQTGYYYGYGYYGSNRTDNISIAYGPPSNINEYLHPPITYFTSYGPPSTGIDSGYKYYPPSSYEPPNPYIPYPVTQKPFTYSQIDPYLSNQNNYQNNLYNNPSYLNQFPYGYKYNTYNKYDNKYENENPLFFKK